MNAWRHTVVWRANSEEIVWRVNSVPIATNWAWAVDRGASVGIAAPFVEQPTNTKKRNSKRENYSNGARRAHHIHPYVCHRQHKNEQQREFHTISGIFCFLFFVHFVIRSFFSLCFASQLFMVEINVCGDRTKAKARVECDSTYEKGTRSGTGMDEETPGNKNAFCVFLKQFSSGIELSTATTTTAMPTPKSTKFSPLTWQFYRYYLFYIFFALLAPFGPRRLTMSSSLPIPAYPLNMILITIRIYIMWLYIEFMWNFLCEIANSCAASFVLPRPPAQNSSSSLARVPSACDDFIVDH